MTLDALRRRFPHVEETTYLNHAAVAPLSRPVVEAMGAFVEERHRTHIDNYVAFESTIEGTLERVARLLGTTPERVEFAPNTSYGLNVLVGGLDWQAGDRVALPACEFPSNVYPFMNLERRGVGVDLIPHRRGAFTLEDVERVLTPRTRLLTLSWVQFLSGFRTDLEAVGKLCRERGVLFCVDAIQGLGALRLDVQRCHVDFLACGGHKWLMAPQGIGFIYLTEALQERLAPIAGWLHGPIDWDDFFSYDLAFHPDARRFRLGTMNGAGIAGLRAALDLHFEAGPGECERRVLANAQALADGLEAQGLRRYGAEEAACASGIVTVEHPEPEALYDHLRQRGIVVALRNRLLRFAPAYYNTADEIEAALEAVAGFGKVSVAAQEG